MASDPLSQMVDRFLAWELPKDFTPDGGVTYSSLGCPSGRPVGTNLLTAIQAKAMLEHVAGPFLARAAELEECLMRIREKTKDEWAVREAHSVLSPRIPHSPFDPPKCPGPDCPMCNGECCDLCGAGCWNNDPDRPICEHDVIDRHNYKAE